MLLCARWSAVHRSSRILFSSYALRNEICSVQPKSGTPIFWMFLLASHVERLFTMKRWDKRWRLYSSPLKYFPRSGCHGPPLVVNRINWISVPVFLFLPESSLNVTEVNPFLSTNQFTFREEPPCYPTLQYP